MMEYDGYHMLSDVLDRPNLREEAMGWIGTDFLPSLRRRGRGLRGHGVDLLYGALATGYMLLAGQLSLYCIERRYPDAARQAGITRCCVASGH